MSGEFSVCQFFVDGSYEYIERNVDVDTAGMRFVSATKTVGARIGTTTRVIITDGGDCTNMEWEYGKGIVFPPGMQEVSGYVDNSIKGPS